MHTALSALIVCRYDVFAVMIVVSSSRKLCAILVVLDIVSMGDGRWVYLRFDLGLQQASLSVGCSV